MFHPRVHFYSVPSWLFNASQNKVSMGIECCSLDSISFHYVTPQEMYEMSRFETYLDFLKPITQK